MLDSFSTALVPSVSIENLVAERNGRIAYVTEAHRLLTAAKIELTFTNSSRYQGCFTTDRGVEIATKQIDAGYWSFLLSESGMQSFLDATARAQWREAIEKHDVPELTEANIKATFSALYSTRGEMFERGVVELFRKLSWKYKTNQPVKLGKRIIMRFCVSTWKRGRDGIETNGVEHGASNKMDDLLRVMHILDGKPEPDHRNASWSTLNGCDWMKGGGPSVATVHGYFEVKGFKNGNAHMTFLRTDLVDAMNRIIAKAHPDALPPGGDED